MIDCVCCCYLRLLFWIFVLFGDFWSLFGSVVFGLIVFIMYCVLIVYLCFVIVVLYFDLLVDFVVLFIVVTLRLVVGCVFDIRYWLLAGLIWFSLGVCLTNLILFVGVWLCVCCLLLFCLVLCWLIVLWISVITVWFILIWNVCDLDWFGGVNVFTWVVKWLCFDVGYCCICFDCWGCLFDVFVCCVVYCAVWVL